MPMQSSRGLCHHGYEGYHPFTVLAVSVSVLDWQFYAGPMLEEGGLEKALEGGPKSVEYTALVEWLSKELKSLCKMEEHVNAIVSPEDSSSFLLEVSSFLKELGCGYSCLLEGHMSERLHTRQNRILLLDFLLTELEAARMVLVNKPELNKTMELQLNESSTASDLKNMLIALKFPKPPANITPGLLFGKVETKMKEVLSKASPELIGKPLFTGVLSEKQWHQLEELHKEMQQEYRLRREMLIKRIDVTIQSFQASTDTTWSERVRNQQDEIASMFLGKRKALVIEPDVHLSDLLAAREDLAIIEKTSNASVRRNTQSSVNKVIIGRVPDRGGRPSDQQPPPPEMPSWQQQRPGVNVVFQEAGVEVAVGVEAVTEEEVVVVGAAIGEEGYREDGTRVVVGIIWFGVGILGLVAFQSRQKSAVSCQSAPHKLKLSSFSLFRPSHCNVDENKLNKRAMFDLCRNRQGHDENKHILNMAVSSFNTV
uniref:Uncharacterized protein n=1 Tax=Timema bartmani TaxID=61472 RepID=A0A7R9EXL8_9NEOP|nr:unnamed protein product [Timema bartmani]